MLKSNPVVVVGRILMAVLFLVSGLGKLGSPGATMGYMASMGLPGVLIWPTILLEVGGGLALALGWQLRFIAPALGVFSLTAAAVFHHNIADQMQRLMLLKDIAIVGGLALAWAIDAAKSDTGATPAAMP